VHVSTLFTLLSVTGLGYALAAGDLGLRYVASWSSYATPLPYRIGAVWAGPSGTLLVWAAALGVGTSLAVAMLPRAGGLRAWVNALLALLLLAVLAMACFDTNPFLHLPFPPDDGRGVPLEWMRPIALVSAPVAYVAQSLVSVPAVIVVMGVIGGDDAWRASARRWTLACLALLTLAVLLDWRRRYGVGDWADDWRWAPVHAGTALAWLGVAVLAGAVMMRVRAAATLTAAFAAFALALVGLTVRRAGGWDGVHGFASSAAGRATGWVLLIAVLVALAGAWGTPVRAALGRAGHALLAAVLVSALALVAAGFGVRLDLVLAEGARGSVVDRFGTTWTLSLEGISNVDRENVGVGIATLRAAVNGRARAYIAPEVRALYSPSSNEPSEELQVTGIAAGPAQDLKVDPRQISRADAVLSVRFIPGVTFLWLGCLAAAIAAMVLAFSAPAAVAQAPVPNAGTAEPAQ
jgi:cytochrome c biogenesis factor